MTDPMNDDALIALALHRLELADQEDATAEAVRQFLDIAPAVIQRLREKTEITRDLVMIEQIDLRDSAALARFMADDQKSKSDDQLQLSLLHL